MWLKLYDTRRVMYGNEECVKGRVNKRVNKLLRFYSVHERKKEKEYGMRGERMTGVGCWLGR